MSEIFLEVNGNRYFGFTEISIERSMEDFANKFSFRTTVIDSSTGVVQNDIKVQDSAKIYVDDTQIINGFVEVLDIDYSSNSHSISYEGRDITGDLVDSSIIKKQYQQRNFKRLAEKVLADNNITNIKVINKVSNIDDFKQNETIEIETNDTIISFLDSYAKKLQVLLMTNSDGNIEIVRESDSINAFILVSYPNYDSNNILSASISTNSHERFYEVKCMSQAANWNFGENSVRQESFAYDNSIRASRKKIIVQGKFAATEELDRLSRWTRNINIAKSATYTCTVQGFYADEKNKILWHPNTLVQIEDSTCQVSGVFLIKTVVFRQSVAGSFTELTIVNRGTFSVVENLDQYSDLNEQLVRTS